MPCWCAPETVSPADPHYERSRTNPKVDPASLQPLFRRAAWSGRTTPRPRPLRSSRERTNCRRDPRPTASPTRSAFRLQASGRDAPASLDREAAPPQRDGLQHSETGASSPRPRCVSRQACATSRCASSRHARSTQCHVRRRSCGFRCSQGISTPPTGSPGPSWYAPSCLLRRSCASRTQPVDDPYARCRQPLSSAQSRFSRVRSLRTSRRGRSRSPWQREPDSCARWRLPSPGLQQDATMPDEWHWCE